MGGYKMADHLGQAPECAQLLIVHMVSHAFKQRTLSFDRHPGAGGSPFAHTAQRGNIGTRRGGLGLELSLSRFKILTTGASVVTGPANL
jgi:hypothetical protein